LWIAYVESVSYTLGTFMQSEEELKKKYRRINKEKDEKPHRDAANTDAMNGLRKRRKEKKRVKEKKKIR